MIGRKLKKYAGEKGFKIKGGFVYGEYRGYLITLREGAGWRSASFAAVLSDETSRAVLHTMLDDRDLRKQYGITQHKVTEAAVLVSFVEKMKTMSLVSDFIDMFCDKLSGMQVPGAGYCSGCGLAVDSREDSAVMVGGAALSMHASCVEKMSREAEDAREEAKTTGSVLTGTLGAIVGGLVGSIPWGIAYYFGWFVGWLGLLIGAAAKKGYELFKGKETKAKAVVIILVTIITVVVAEFVTLGVSIYLEFSRDSLFSGSDLSIINAFQFMFYILPEDPEIFRSVVGDIVVGWIFAGLGIAGTIKQIFSETDTKSNLPVKL